MLDVFHTPIEERFERITRLARHCLNVRVAGVSLVSNEKQWFKSIAGWPVSELPLDQSLCAKVVDGDESSFVSDLQSHPVLADHPLVVDRPRFRFYAGHPLVDRHDNAVGTFCVMDVRPRELSLDERQCFRDLALIAQRELLTDQLSDAQRALVGKLGAARREAMIDPLTRLWNRRGATVMLRAAFEQADDAHSMLALGLFDIDHFKQINDVHGHQIGDEALRKVARTLTSCIRGDDVICRPGGDEFLMIITATDEAQAAKLVERVRRTVSERAIATRDGDVPVTLSAGCAVRGPRQGITENELFAQADDALRQSKAAGRNQLRMAG
jgi:diguanylate cyclase (GGDEF)-like protein